MSEDNKIGGLNGKWAILFKAQLAVGAFFMPMIVSWCVWATVQLFTLQQEIVAFKALGPRYTATDAQVDQLKMKEFILAEFDKRLRPTWLTDELAELSLRIKELEKEIRNGR